MKSLHAKILLFAWIIWLVSNLSSPKEYQDKTEKNKDICMLESFQPRCLKNEVILMKIATYGRMRIGRCVKAEEVAAHKSVVGDDPRYLGCSADVLSILDSKCSGKPDCDVRLSDIPDEIQPCFPGLKMYLEIHYDCINIVDSEHSCTVISSKIPANIMTIVQQRCGTKSQPWTVEAPMGQKIAIVLLNLHGALNYGGGKQSCQNFGVIVEKAEKRNTSICFDDALRETEIYSSTGNAIEIFFNILDQQEIPYYDNRLILQVKAVGCSDIVPPEDTWLKRTADAIIIGCYSSRQKWHLSCKDEKWIGVLGNCTTDMLPSDSKLESGLISRSAMSHKAEVLSVVAIGGFTLAICLIIICVGAVCLRKYYNRLRKKEAYKTLNCHAVGILSQQSNGASTFNRDMMGNEMSDTSVRDMPTYSVYLGQSNEF